MKPDWSPFTSKTPRLAQGLHGLPISGEMNETWAAGKDMIESGPGFFGLPTAAETNGRVCYSWQRLQQSFIVPEKFNPVADEAIVPLVFVQKQRPQEVAPFLWQCYATSLSLAASSPSFLLRLLAAQGNVGRAALQPVPGAQPPVCVHRPFNRRAGGVPLNHRPAPPAGDAHQVALGAAAGEPAVGEAVPELVGVEAVA